MMGDPVLIVAQRRKIAQDKIVALQMQRKAVCGCERCGDFDRLEDLRVRIQVEAERVAELSDQITDLFVYAYQGAVSG